MRTSWETTKLCARTLPDLPVQPHRGGAATVKVVSSIRADGGWSGRPYPAPIGSAASAITRPRMRRPKPGRKKNGLQLSQAGRLPARPMQPWPSPAKTAVIPCRRAVRRGVDKIVKILFFRVGARGTSGDFFRKFAFCGYPKPVPRRARFAPVSPNWPPRCCVVAGPGRFQSKWAGLCIHRYIYSCGAQPARELPQLSSRHEAGVSSPSCFFYGEKSSARSFQ